MLAEQNGQIYRDCLSLMITPWREFAKKNPCLLSLVPVRCPLLLYLLLCFFAYVVLSVTLYQLDELQQLYQMING